MQASLNIRQADVLRPTTGQRLVAAGTSLIVSALLLGSVVIGFGWQADRAAEAVAQAAVVQPG